MITVPGQVIERTNIAELLAAANISARSQISDPNVADIETVPVSKMYINFSFICFFKYIFLFFYICFLYIFEIYELFKYYQLQKLSEC